MSPGSLAASPQALNSGQDLQQVCRAVQQQAELGSSNNSSHPGSGMHCPTLCQDQQCSKYSSARLEVTPQGLHTFYQSDGLLL